MQILYQQIEQECSGRALQPLWALSGPSANYGKSVTMVKTYLVLFAVEKKIHSNFCVARCLWMARYQTAQLLSAQSETQQTSKEKKPISLSMAAEARSIWIIIESIRSMKELISKMHKKKNNFSFSDFSLEPEVGFFACSLKLSAGFRTTEDQL